KIFLSSLLFVTFFFQNGISPINTYLRAKALLRALIITVQPDMILHIKTPIFVYAKKVQAFCEP
ncbi:hypothetical protein ACP6PL_05820, partial [Dapis sp. BLCC M126]|uniref:hypothetical protein n=1 Tax=Dapis sp. BLCC M126 TaxID=3400189 RepID=UPI003CF3BDF2